METTADGDRKKYSVCCRCITGAVYIFEKRNVVTSIQSIFAMLAPVTCFMRALF